MQYGLAFPADIPVESDLDSCVTNNGQYAAVCEHSDMTCSDDDGLWTCCDTGECFSLHEPSDMLISDFSDAHSIRTVGLSGPCDVEVVLDLGADGSVFALGFGALGHPDKIFDGSNFIDAQGKPINVKGC